MLPSGNPGLTIEPWVFYDGLRFDDSSAAYRYENISLTKVEDFGNVQEWWETSGGVTLVFSGDGLEAVSLPYGLERDVRHAVAPADRPAWDGYVKQETAGVRRAAVPSPSF